MTYRVVITARAKIQLFESALWWAEHRDLDQAARWLDAFEAAVSSLTKEPQRLPTAREDHLFDYTLRRLVFGIGKKPTHRALFEVRGDVVYVRAIRHLHQDDVTPDDLG
jgi:plasmid stabilization system protein ParE